MKSNQTALIRYACVLFLFCVVSWPSSAPALNIGDPFPVFSNANTLTDAECAYFKITCNQPFKLGDIPHEVIIIEFLNVYCHTCRMQVKIFNELYTSLLKDADLAEKVCILGLAVGNSPDEIKSFKSEFGARYPILSDQQKIIFHSTGNIQGTPHTYILRKEDRRFIVDYHAGGVSSHERYLESIRHTLRNSLTGTNVGNKLPLLRFSDGSSRITTQELAGTNYFLYFASSRSFDLELDTRNMAVQLEVLRAVVKNHSDVSAFVFPPVDMPTAAVPPPLRAARDNVDNLRDKLALENAPTLVFINEYGRIGYKSESIPTIAAENLIAGQEYKPNPQLSENEIITLINKHLSHAGHKIVDTERLVLENREALYVTTIAPKGSGLFLFSRLESGITMCDVCHDSHFIYVFDQNGEVTDFIPLALTKFGNVAWTDDDIAKMKTNLVGKNIFNTFPFNPKVDAVTTGTMTSSLIYEALNNGRTILKYFKDYRFRADYWKKRCFSVICKVQAAIATRRAENAAFVLDDTALQKVLDETGVKGCPIGGMYIVLDGDILCSDHGLNLDGCPKQQ